jgi:hypothetical protein
MLKYSLFQIMRVRRYICYRKLIVLTLWCILIGFLVDTFIESSVNEDSSLNFLTPESSAKTKQKPLSSRSKKKL